MAEHRRGGLGGRKVAGAAALLLAIVGAALLVVGLSVQQSPPTVARAEPQGVAGTRSTAGAAPPPADPVTGPVMAPSTPTRLTIPTLGVQHALSVLGSTPDGRMQVPPLDAVEVPGWYDGSPTPGEVGPAIVLGHIDSARDGPGVFFRLGDLRPGDRVEVDRADGTTAGFEVDDVGRYPKSDFPTLRVYRDLDHAGLRLITCGGPFDAETRNYRDNVVVFAHLTDRRPT